MPEYLDADLGLYSKFKNIRLVDEYSIYEPKGLDGHSFTSPKATKQSIDTIPLSPELAEKAAEEKSYYGRGYILSILITIFSVEFGNLLTIYAILIPPI